MLRVNVYGGDENTACTPVTYLSKPANKTHVLHEKRCSTCDMPAQVKHKKSGSSLDISLSKAVLEATSVK